MHKLVRTASQAAGVNSLLGRPMDNSGNEARLTARSQDSQAMMPYWKKVDDVRGGIEAMKAARKDYLPTYPGEDAEAYNFRLSLAQMTNIYSDAVGNLASKPFEQEISFPVGDGVAREDVFPPEILEFIENVDGAGNNLTRFASEVFYNGIDYTHDWIMINFPRPVQVPGRMRTRADDKAEGIRPYWTRVPATNVKEVKTINQGGYELPSYVRIHEPKSDSQSERYREFELVDGAVKMTIWERLEAGQGTGEFVPVEDTPTMLTITRIPMVPFITGKRDGRRWFFTAELSDALELQISLYRKESGLEFADTMTAYPMLVMIGVKSEKAPDGKPMPLQVGPSRTLWIPPDGNGNAGNAKYLEPSASSLTYMGNRIDKIKQDLRELCKQPLTAQTGNLTTISAGMAAGKTRSTVSAWGLRLKDALENALVITCEFLDISREAYDPEVVIFDEYDDFSDTSSEVTELGSARRAKDISQETYWGELKRRGILAAEFDAAAEKKRLLKESPGDEGEDDEDNPPQ